MPFVQYTNGYDTYYWDTDLYPPVKVHGFPTPMILNGNWSGVSRSGRCHSK